MMYALSVSWVEFGLSRFLSEGTLKNASKKILEGRMEFIVSNRYNAFFRGALGWEACDLLALSQVRRPMT